MSIQPRFLTVEQAAQYLGLSLRTLNNWRCLGAGPRFHKFNGRMIRYKIEDLDSFAAAGARASTSDPGLETIQ